MRDILVVLEDNGCKNEPNRIAKVHVFHLDKMREISILLNLHPGGMPDIRYVCFRIFRYQNIQATLQALKIFSFSGPTSPPLTFTSTVGLQKEFSRLYQSWPLLKESWRL